MLKSIMVAICMTFLLTACWQNPEITDATIVANNAQAFNECLKNILNCRGGFVKWSNGRIVRIMDCSSACRNDEMSIDSIQTRMNMKQPWLPSYVEWVALPSDTTVWEKAAIAHAQKFVHRH